MDRESDQDLFAGLKSGGEEYSVYDAHYERIGRWTMSSSTSGTR